MKPPSICQQFSILPHDFFEYFSVKRLTRVLVKHKMVYDNRWLRAVELLVKTVRVLLLTAVDQEP